MNTPEEHDMSTPTAPGYYGAHAEPPPPPRKSRARLWLTVGLIALALIVIGMISNRGSDTSAASSVTVTSNTEIPGVPSGVDPSTYRQRADPVIVAAPSGPLTDVPPGDYEVGTGDGQVAPGKYKGANPEGYCSVARLKNGDGSSGDIIDYNNSNGPIIVTVKKTDGYVKVTGCTLTKA